MKKVAGVLMCLCLCGSVSVMAQRHPEHPERNMEEMANRRAERLADDFKLKDEARADFLSLYKAYQQELTAQRMERERPEVKKAADYTEEEAKARIQESFDRKARQIVIFYNRLEIDKKYYEKFSTMLSGKQLMRIFAPMRNIDNRNHAAKMRGGRHSGGMPTGRGGALDASADRSSENPSEDF